MRTIRTKVYQFSELSESAKQKAIESNYDINVFSDWWESVYDDAQNVGLIITGFDIDRASYCTGNLGVNTAWDVATKIMQEHGEICETYKTAANFISDWNELVSQHSDGINTEKVTEDKAEDFDPLAEDMENDFIHSLLEDYRIMLSKEYDYLTSKEAIIETIEANEYEFKADGTRF